MANRTAKVTRKTKETDIVVELALDGQGRVEVSTGIGFLDHMLSQLGHHGLFDVTIKAEGDLAVDQHHTVEDVAIALGQAFDKALGDRRGIVRFGHAYVPLDEALALAAVDLGGRGYAVVEAKLQGETVGQLTTSLFTHFLETLAREARMNLHALVIRGEDDHHKAEALFKALARALDTATQIDPRRLGQIPSTKGDLA